MGRINKRDTVLDIAEGLFERNGFVATGVNQITKEAGVASMTLYNNFANKDELILATLQRRADRFFTLILEQIDFAGDEPKARLIAIFDTVDNWISGALKNTDAFCGCMFVKASIEFGEISHPAHKMAAEHKLQLVDLLEDNVKQLGLKDSRNIALSLHLLIDGAITQAQLLGDKNSAKRAKALAINLLEQVQRDGT